MYRSDSSRLWVISQKRRLRPDSFVDLIAADFIQETDLFRFNEGPIDTGSTPKFTDHDVIRIIIDDRIAIFVQRLR